MLAERDKRMGFDTADERRDRADLAARARPQGGVEALRDRFPGATGAPAGVVDNGDTSTRAVPRLAMEPQVGSAR